MTWISPNTITGDAATDKRYFRRDRINDTFWREIKKGNHILFTAPRRVGKTSIMKDLAENPPEGYVCIYQNIEGVKSKNEFYQRLFTLIIQCLDRSKIDKVKAFLKKCLTKYQIQEVTTSGLKIGTVPIEYEDELRNLIPSLAECEVHSIIFLDEFAEVIHRLSESGKKEDAIDILHTLREIRSSKAFAHFSIVYAGSVGLEFVIRSIDRPKLINDLHAIETDALTTEEAAQFITQLTEGATLQISPATVNHLLKTTEHLLPYYLQLMLEELDIMAMRQQRPTIANGDIDAAFESVLAKNKNFEDWLERLRAYQPAHFRFINQILIQAAHKGQLTIQEIYNIANDERFQRQDDYMDFIDQLVHDGYLLATAEQSYRFISPFLKRFWQKKFPVYHG